jgi:REP element-mobilizing transposase RayT
MPYTKILVHLVWATKKRDPSIRKEIRSRLINHIMAYASEKGIFIIRINCHIDHVHCLITLGIDQNVSKVVQLMKGESSHWVNQQKLVAGRFAWQEDYFAVSVSESGVERVKDYIRNQEEHHKKKTFQDEYLEFLRVYGFKELG